MVSLQRDLYFGWSMKVTALPLPLCLRCRHLFLRKRAPFCQLTLTFPLTGELPIRGVPSSPTGLAWIVGPCKALLAECEKTIPDKKRPHNEVRPFNLFIKRSRRCCFLQLPAECLCNQPRCSTSYLYLREEAYR